MQIYNNNIVLFIKTSVQLCKVDALNWAFETIKQKLYANKNNSSLRQNLMQIIYHLMDGQNHAFNSIGSQESIKGLL